MVAQLAPICYSGGMIKTAEKLAGDKLVQDLFKVGAHYGFSRSLRHPSVKNFIFGFKNRGTIIDLGKASESLKIAGEFLHKLGSENKMVLMVGSKAEARVAVESLGERLALPYVINRWIGGTLTNYPEIKKRITRLQELTEKRQTGGFDGHTKKERLLFDREIAKLERYFSKLIPLTRLPDALLAVDSKAEEIAVAEATKLGIPVISLSGTDCDINKIAYPIVVNDSALSGIKFMLEELMKAYQAGKTAGVLARAEQAEKIEKEKEEVIAEVK